MGARRRGGAGGAQACAGAGAGAVHPLLASDRPSRPVRRALCSHVVSLRGVGAMDTTDLVSMRESMFVVQVGPDWQLCAWLWVRQPGLMQGVA